MKRPIALLVGALVAAGSTVAPASPALADWNSTVISGDGWSMTVMLPDARWDQQFLPNFFPCAGLEFRLYVETADTTNWGVAGQIRLPASGTVLEEFSTSGTGPGLFFVPGIEMCEHFNAPTAPPDGRYGVTGVATVATSTTPTLPFSTAVLISPMSSYPSIDSYSDGSGASVFRGYVRMVAGSFTRPVTGGSVVLERLESGYWITAGDGTWIGDGAYTASAGTILPLGTFVRVLYSGDYSVAASTSAVFELRPPVLPTAPIVPFPIPVVTSPAPTPVVVVPPTARVTIRAVSARSKLRVDVNPNMGSKYWTFQVQRRNSDGSWKALKTYRTWGSTEKRTLNLRKGAYRVWVNPKFGHQGAMSATVVTLKR